MKEDMLLCHYMVVVWIRVVNGTVTTRIYVLSPLSTLSKGWQHKLLPRTGEFILGCTC